MGVDFDETKWSNPEILIIDQVDNGPDPEPNPDSDPDLALYITGEATGGMRK